MYMVVLGGKLIKLTMAKLHTEMSPGAPLALKVPLPPRCGASYITSIPYLFIYSLIIYFHCSTKEEFFTDHKSVAVKIVLFNHKIFKFVVQNVDRHIFL